MLGELKSFKIDGAGLEDLVALSAFGKQLQAEFTAQQLPVPAWIDDKVRSLSRAIRTKSQDLRELRLAEIAAEESKLKTAAERRAELQKEKDALLQGV